METNCKYIQTDQKLPVKDTAYSDAFGIAGFTESTFNPDDLIGRKGFKVYRKMMTDEQVKAVVRFKRDAITAREWFFSLDSEDLSEEEIERRLFVANAIIKKMDGAFTDALNGMMSSMYNGFSMTEKTYKIIKCRGLSYWGLRHLRVKPFDTFYFDTDGFGNLVKVRQRVSGRDIILDADKFVHFVQNPDVDQWYGQSELREAYRSWYSKNITLRIQNIFLERTASGFTWITPPQDRTIKEGSSDHTRIMDILRNLQAGTGVLLPNGFDLHVEFPKSDPGFDKAINFHDLAIAKALLVPNLMGLSHQGSAGSFAQSKTQLEGFLWMLDSDKERLEEALNEQLFRDLFIANFGDEHVPELQFKPLSKSQLFELAKSWMELVTGGAVEASESDEQHLRDMLGFPPKSEEDDEGRVSSDNALQGQQIDAMMKIVSAVQQGAMSKATAGEILVASFPLRREQAERILANVEVAPQQQPGSQPAGEPAPRQDDPTGVGGNGPDVQGQPPGSDTAGSGEPVEETIIGNGLVSVSAFTKATKRVDFAVIQQRTEALEADHAETLAKRVQAMVSEVFDTFEGDALGNDDLRTIQGFEFSQDTKREFRRSVKAMLEGAWKLGERHARDEIDKAKGENFSIGFKREKLKFISDEFFNIKSFTITGDFTADFLAKIKNILLNGAKGDKTTKEVRDQIIALAVSEGVVSREFAEEELGRALEAGANPVARLNNIVRTNTFEAINEARFAFFTDPQTDGFVEALEYSAILDSRTTQICEHLDGRVYPVGAEEWSSYRPPNHFQCRSLLIPVTVVDQWTESETPTINPQKGFG